MVTVGGNIDEIWILPINSTISAMSTKSYGERIPLKSRNVFSFDKFIYFSFMLTSQSSRLLINSNDKTNFLCIYFISDRPTAQERFS